jgi:hypothetical protein
MHNMKCNMKNLTPRFSIRIDHFAFGSFPI